MEDAYDFYFQSRELYGIVSGTKLKTACITVAIQQQWAKRDKSVCVAILSTINKQYCTEIINFSTSHAMWTKLATYHQQHSEKCIILLREQYYSCRLTKGESLLTFLSTVEKLAKQLTDLGEVVFDCQIISKIRCGLPPSYD